MAHTSCICRRDGREMHAPDEVSAHPPPAHATQPSVLPSHNYDAKARLLRSVFRKASNTWLQTSSPSKRVRLSTRNSSGMQKQSIVLSQSGGPEAECGAAAVLKTDSRRKAPICRMP